MRVKKKKCYCISIGIQFNARLRPNYFPSKLSEYGVLLLMLRCISFQYSFILKLRFHFIQYNFCFISIRLFLQHDATCNTIQQFFLLFLFFLKMVINVYFIYFMSQNLQWLALIEPETNLNRFVVRKEIFRFPFSGMFCWKVRHKPSTMLSTQSVKKKEDFRKFTSANFAEIRQRFSVEQFLPLTVRPRSLHVPEK